MLGRQDFIACVADTLKAKGYGAKRTSEIVEDYKWRIADYESRGVASNDAATRAMADVYAKVAQRTIDKTVGARKNLMVLGEIQKRLDQVINDNIRTSALFFDGKAHNGPGVALARALYSTLVVDPRVKGTAWESMYRSRYRYYWSYMSNVLKDFSKGTFGRQRGAAHFDAIVDELFGNNTGNAAAKEIANAYKNLQTIMVRDFREVGGAIDWREDFVLPQKQNPVKLGRAKQAQWVADHMEWLDWDRMRFPDGDPIRPEQREEVLGEVFKTLNTDGATKIEPGIARGQGASIGNAVDNHRFLVYKDAPSWKAMHEKYGDGTVYDVVQRHIDNMARRVSMVDQFGRNPDLMVKAMIAQGERKAGEVASGAKDEAAARAREDFSGGVQRFRQMAADQMGRSPGDANSVMAASVHATSNIITGTLLGSSLAINMAGDFLTTNIATRIANKMPIIGEYIATYLKGMAPGGYRNAQMMAARAGHIMDEVIGATYNIERWSGVATYGPEWSRRAGDVMLRLGGLNRHTNTLRWAHQAEMMGMLHDYRATDFQNIPFRQMMERYGITADDWNVVRELTPTATPKPNVEYLQPIDILKIAHADKQKLFDKFSAMIDAESRYLTPDSSLEARTYLRGGTAPTSLPGALMYSFSMFKNFPISFAMNMGRLGISLPTYGSRIAFTSALIVGTIAAGAVATQLNEVARGRKPMPMNTTAFALKALLNGGGLGIWGNYLIQGISEDHTNVYASLAGPLASFVNDTALMALGDSYSFMKAMDQAERFDGKLGQRVATWLKSYTPGSRLWYARLVLEREIFDRLDEWLDPRAAQKRQQKISRQKRNFGNDYFSAPGERILTGQ